VGLLPPFFHLTTTFFGLTSEHKAALLEEVYICLQHLKGVTYTDVLAMPVYERRYFLSLLTKESREREERNQEMVQKENNSNAKGNRKTRISGDALKHRMNSGDVPLV
jgi:hypothetical protein